MTDLRILVVDDDRASGLYLKKIIEDIPGTVVAAATSGRDGLKKSLEFKPQAAFLDVDMPEMNGLELAQALTREHGEILLVFATAYTDYAFKAFELDSVDYLLKPFNEERVRKAVGKIRERLQRPSHLAIPEENIIIDDHGKRIFLKPSEILYVESCKPQIHIKTRKDDYRFRGSLQLLERQLSKYGFFQSHRSYLVNLRYVRQIIHSGTTYQILLDGSETVMLSRQQAAKLRKLL